MIVGVLRETEPGERRVALVPDGVKVLTGLGFAQHADDHGASPSRAGV